MVFINLLMQPLPEQREKLRPALRQKGFTWAPSKVEANWGLLGCCCAYSVRVALWQPECLGEPTFALVPQGASLSSDQSDPVGNVLPWGADSAVAAALAKLRVSGSFPKVQARPVGQTSKSWPWQYLPLFTSMGSRGITGPRWGEHRPAGLKLEMTPSGERVGEAQRVGRREQRHAPSWLQHIPCDLGTRLNLSGAES